MEKFEYQIIFIMRMLPLTATHSIEILKVAIIRNILATFPKC